MRRTLLPLLLLGAVLASPGCRCQPEPPRDPPTPAKPVPPETPPKPKIQPAPAGGT